MCQYSATASFFENDVTERNQDNLLTSNFDSKDDHEHGCSMESDLDYPLIVLSKTKHFPFCPEKKNQKKTFFRKND